MLPKCMLGSGSGSAKRMHHRPPQETRADYDGSLGHDANPFLVRNQSNAMPAALNTTNRAKF
jgi:hypothetical protein